MVNLSRNDTEELNWLDRYHGCPFPMPLFNKAFSGFTLVCWLFIFYVQTLSFAELPVPLIPLNQFSLETL